MKMQIQPFMVYDSKQPILFKFVSNEHLWYPFTALSTSKQTEMFIVYLLSCYNNLLSIYTIYSTYYYLLYFF